MNRAWNVLALSLPLLVAPSAAFAVDFQGAWPDRDATVTLDVDDRPVSQALREAAESAGVGLVETLPDNLPPVTVHVRNAPLRDVLSAVLGDAPVIATRSGSMLVLRPGSVTAASPTAVPPVPPVPQPPTPPGGWNAFVPPVPPAFPAWNNAHPPAAGAPDRTTFGEDVTVHRNERVHDVTTMGGDVTVEGEVTGSVTTMGGDVKVRRGATVYGDLVTMGGDVDVDEGAMVMGRRVGIGDAGNAALGRHSGSSGRHHGWQFTSGEFPRGLSDAPGRVVRFALLFLLGMLLMGAAPARLGALQRTVIRAPLRSAGMGALAFPAGILLIAVLAITIVGIPAAIVVALAGSLALFIGLAAVASVLGAMLPAPQLKERPVLQLGAGVLAMLAISFVPVVGALSVAIAAMIGLGAVVLTRFKHLAPGDPGFGVREPVAAGPYRTNAG